MPELMDLVPAAPALPERDRLVADIDGRAGETLRLELIVLRDAVGLDPFLLERGERDRAHVVGAMISAARAAGTSLYRLDPGVYATLGDRRACFAAVAAAKAAMLDLPGADPGCVMHGDARLPHDAQTGEDALAAAVARLHERASLQRHSAERQVRDVLLTLLDERGGPGRRAERPSVAAHAVAVGRRLGLEVAELDVLVRAAELQDLGRLLIPDAILDKDAGLTIEEWAIVREHPLVGERILRAARGLAPVAALVRSCAEHFDGSGYPDALAGAAIPLGARIIAVCAAFEAMTSGRPYRPALSAEAALAELCRCAGYQFDPHVVVVFCRVAVELLSPCQEVA
jgi:two-component system cell cycle response regulator